MDTVNLWTSALPRELKTHFEDFYRYLSQVNDGTMNVDALLATPYVVTDNSPHWPPITSAEIGWAFLKQFKKID